MKGAVRRGVIAGALAFGVTGWLLALSSTGFHDRALFTAVMCTMLTACFYPMISDGRGRR